MQIERDYMRSDFDKNKKPLSRKELRIKKLRSMSYRIYSKPKLSLYDKLNVRLIEWQLSKALGIKW